MSMASKIRTLAVSAICLTVCSSLATSLAAQQAIPNAPQLQQFPQPAYPNAPAAQPQQGQAIPNAPFVQQLQNPQPRAVSNHYVPRFMRPASNPAATGTRGDFPVARAGFGTAWSNQEVIETPAGEYFVEDGYSIDEGYSSCDACGECNSCSTCFGGTDADCYECGPAIDPRDCGMAKDCWLNGLGGLFCNSEFFFGTQGFKSQVFVTPGANQPPENCSFGFHAGFNTGLPLYKITCGLVSGQIGANFVQSNFEDGFLSSGDRQQTFFTAGLFRRVDYGLQFGAVADVFRENWINEVEVIQMRSELSWVWPSGQSLGFRYTDMIQDDPGDTGGVPGPTAQSIDNYRLFYRHSCFNGGYAEGYFGRSDEQHSIYGVDFDLPLSSRIALQSGFTYLQPDDTLQFSDNEAWNITLALSFRPRGNDWYKFYHRPLFDVADNGSMIISRQ